MILYFIFEYKIWLSRLLSCLHISLIISFGCSKEPSHWDGSIEHLKHIFSLRNKVLYISRDLGIYESIISADVTEVTAIFSRVDSLDFRQICPKCFRLWFACFQPDCIFNDSINIFSLLLWSPRTEWADLQENSPFGFSSCLTSHQCLGLDPLGLGRCLRYFGLWSLVAIPLLLLHPTSGLEHFFICTFDSINAVKNIR